MKKTKMTSFVFLLISLLLMLSVQGCSSYREDSVIKENYKKGITSYDTGDFALAQSYFEKTKGYNDTDIYLGAISKKSIQSGATVEKTTVTSSATVVKETDYREAYYQKGIKLFESGDFRSALDQFKLASGYLNADQYVSVCVNKINAQWSSQLPPHLVPKIVIEKGKEVIVRGKENEYEKIYFVDMNSASARVIIDSLLKSYPNRTEDQIKQLLRDPALSN